MRSAAACCSSTAQPRFDSCAEPVGSGVSGFDTRCAQTHSDLNASGFEAARGRSPTARTVPVFDVPARTDSERPRRTGFEALRAQNPVARSLPMLDALARTQKSRRALDSKRFALAAQGHAELSVFDALRARVSKAATHR